MDATQPLETVDDLSIPGNDPGDAAEARPIRACGNPTGTDALVDLATKMGLDAAAVRTALETRRYRGPGSWDGLATDPAAVMTDADAHATRVRAWAAVPAFIIDRHAAEIGHHAVIVARGAGVLLGVPWQARRDADGTCAAGGCPSPAG